METENHFSDSTNACFAGDWIITLLVAIMATLSVLLCPQRRTPRIIYFTLLYVVLVLALNHAFLLYATPLMDNHGQLSATIGFCLPVLALLGLTILICVQDIALWVIIFIGLWLMMGWIPSIFDIILALLAVILIYWFAKHSDLQHRIEIFVTSLVAALVIVVCIASLVLQASAFSDHIAGTSRGWNPLNPTAWWNATTNADGWHTHDINILIICDRSALSLTTESSPVLIVIWVMLVVLVTSFRILLHMCCDRAFKRESVLFTFQRTEELPASAKPGSTGNCEERKLLIVPR